MADGDSGQQGQQQENFNPVEARTFLQGFGHSVDKIPDAELPNLYTTVKGNVDNLTKTHVDTAIKERGEFGPNWRQAIAGDDAEALKTLERMQHPKDVFKSYSELRTKMSKGELKSSVPFPDKGTDEQKAAWRAEQGVPATPEAYEIKPPEGVVIGEADKPFIDGFLKHAHSKNWTPDKVSDAIAYWGQQRIARQEEAAQQKAEMTKNTSDALHAEWGTEYRPTINKVDGLLDATVDDAELKAAIKGSAETSAGFSRFLATIATQLNPTSTLVSGDAGAQISSVTDWLSKADKLMRTDRKAYDKTMANDYQKYAEAYQRQSGKPWGKR